MTGADSAARTSAGTLLGPGPMRTRSGRDAGEGTKGNPTLGSVDTSSLVRLAERLRRRVEVAEHPLELGLYRRDASLYDGRAGLVVFPRSTEEVVDCVRAARQFGVPFVPRGSGTGLAGGATPLDG